jgi:hypothetical protein
MWTIPSQAPEGEGVTTIPKGSTLKRVEARGTRKGEDIVSSAWQHAAVERRARRSAPCRRSCFKKTFIISGTQEKVAKAGRRSEIARQAVKQMRELKNDTEYAIVRNQAASAGDTNTGRSLGSMENWIGATSPSSASATNVILATSAIGVGSWDEVASGAPGAIVDEGTTAAFIEADLRLALQASWDDGGDPDTVLCAASVKNYINDFTSLATRNVDLGRTQQATITGAADLLKASSFIGKPMSKNPVNSGELSQETILSEAA